MNKKCIGQTAGYNIEMVIKEVSSIQSIQCVREKTSCERKVITEDKPINQGLYSVHRFLCVYVTQTSIVPKYI